MLMRMADPPVPAVLARAARLRRIARGARAGKILVLDDEPEIVDELASYLSFIGFEVEVAPDGHAAERMILTDPDILLLLTDLRMAEIDGLTLLRRLESAPEKRGTFRTIVLTGHATEDVVREVKRCNVAALLRKPCNLADVGAAIKAAMDDLRDAATTERRNLLIAARRCAVAA